MKDALKLSWHGGEVTAEIVPSGPAGYWICRATDSGGRAWSGGCWGTHVRYFKTAELARESLISYYGPTDEDAYAQTPELVAYDETDQEEDNDDH